MSILTPARGTGRIRTVNPVAKLLAPFALGVFLLVTVDWVSAAVALVLECVLFFWAGLSFGAFVRRTAAVWIAAPLAGITTVLYGLP